jgi:hypothetical protein
VRVGAEVRVERQGARTIPTCTNRPRQQPRPLQISRSESACPS